MRNSILTPLDSAAGENISNINTLHDLMTTAKFDFDVEKTSLHTPEGDDVPGKFLLRRTDNNFALGVVGNRYNPIDTERMLEPFHEMVQQFGAHYESAGLIRGGKKCWVSATLPGNFLIPGRTHDIIEQRIVAMMSHDGLGRNSYFTLAHRVVCNNQLRLLTDAAQKSLHGFTHTKNWENSLENAHAGFAAALQMRVNLEKILKQLAEVKMNESQVRNFSNRLYRVSKDKKTTTRAEKRTEQLVELFKHGMGNQGNSRWDALNAVTEMLDHHQRKNYKTQAQERIASQNRFMSNNISGYGDSIKQRALSLLTDRELTFAN